MYLVLWVVSVCHSQSRHTAVQLYVMYYCTRLYSSQDDEVTHQYSIRPWVKFSRARDVCVFRLTPFATASLSADTGLSLLAFDFLTSLICATPASTGAHTGGG